MVAEFDYTVFFYRIVEPHDFLDAIEEAEHSSEEENVERVICGAVKYLRANRAKPEPAMYLGLMYLAKTRPQLFASEVITEVRPTYCIPMGALNIINFSI